MVGWIVSPNHLAMTHKRALTYLSIVLSKGVRKALVTPGTRMDASLQIIQLSWKTLTLFGSEKCDNR